jgi:hypothetical protein
MFPEPRTPDPAEVVAAQEVASMVTRHIREPLSPRVVTEFAAQRGLLAVSVRWWLSDSKWF